MSFIALVLITKIVVTGLLSAAPFLFLPAVRLGAMTGAGPGGSTLFRLYGVAILALLIGYSFGLYGSIRGEFPWGAVAMGLVSNGGAAAVLFGSGAWRNAKPISFFVITVTALLVAAALTPLRSLQPLW